MGDPMTDDGCTTCGMANVSEEFHPHALCLLVKARHGDTAKARSDLAFIIERSRDADTWVQQRIRTFLANTKRYERNSR
jgi:hypothetical protein